MPLYEYHCKKCEAVFEVLHKRSTDLLTVHETCGGSLERLISPSAFHFKGSGWYVTDYGRSAKRDGSAPKSAKDDSKAASPKAETKTESTPAKPAESKA
jgi:putative FmdB family regulatory protein